MKKAIATSAKAGVQKRVSASYESQDGLTAFWAPAFAGVAERVEL